MPQKRLDDAIHNFLDATCELTPRWFNKPKFHIILHLPEHIRRFGPPMLFATEGFESFNAVIRAHSIHSNHQAPSRDIALGMAHHNRVRHLLSGGYFHMPRVINGEQDEELDGPADVPAGYHMPQSPWLWRMKTLQSAGRNLDHIRWRHAASEPIALLALNNFDRNILGMFRFDSSRSNDGEAGA